MTTSRPRSGRILPGSALLFASVAWQPVPAIAALFAGQRQVRHPENAIGMQPGQPSRTALGAARLRAAHQVLDDASILADPLAAAHSRRRHRGVARRTRGRTRPGRGCAGSSRSAAASPKTRWRRGRRRRDTARGARRRARYAGLPHAARDRLAHLRGRSSRDAGVEARDAGRGGDRRAGDAELRPDRFRARDPGRRARRGRFRCRASAASSAGLASCPI